MHSNSEKLEVPCPQLQTSEITLDIFKVIPGVGGNLMHEQQELIAWGAPDNQQYALKDQGRFANGCFHSLPGLSPQLFPPNMKVGQAQLFLALILLFLRIPMSPKILSLQVEKEPE